MGRFYKRKSKYGNKKTIVDGITFASKKEASRYVQLKILQSVGEISNLERQVKFEFTINEVSFPSYFADFVYLEDGEEVVEDVKGYRTDVYKIKRLLMKAVYDIDIRET